MTSRLDQEEDNNQWFGNASFAHSSIPASEPLVPVSSRNYSTLQDGGYHDGSQQQPFHDDGLNNSGTSAAYNSRALSFAAPRSMPTITEESYLPENMSPLSINTTRSHSGMHIGDYDCPPLSTPGAESYFVPPFDPKTSSRHFEFYAPARNGYNQSLPPISEIFQKNEAAQQNLSTALPEVLWSSLQDPRLSNIHTPSFPENFHKDFGDLIDGLQRARHDLRHMAGECIAREKDRVTLQARINSIERLL
ncbi:hypothetical protein M231_04596 [Tremella mesenterica]|uniref:Uncharacterized protein n=1 Tax=Tremella mesenterica TaxID=5217 RepID=A0A4Q1BK87_TREME|nr:hypothetical protein M231_04596 [Tremella mesenterica]